MALSSVVFIEPAPYDLLVLFLVVAIFPLGLRVPREIAVAVFLLALVLAGNLMAAIFSDDIDVTVRALATRTYMVIAWFLFVCILTASPREVLRVLWRGYTFAALLATIWGGLEYYGMLPEALGGDAFGRAKGPFKDANVFAPFLVPVALYTVSRILRSRGLVLGFEVMVFVTLALGLLLAFSRGGWFNFLAAFTLFLAFQIASAPMLRDKTRVLLLAMFLALAAVMALTWAVNNTAAGQQFFARATLFQEYDLARGGRFDTQGKVVRQIGSNPLGVGPGMSANRVGLDPHNLYLHMTLEGGWIAGLGFVLFLLLSLARGLVRITARWELQSDLQVVYAALCGTLMQSLFIDSTHWRHLWLLLAMLWGLTIAFDRDRATGPIRDYV
jgi:hypothetical protein